MSIFNTIMNKIFGAVRSGTNASAPDDQVRRQSEAGAGGSAPSSASPSQAQPVAQAEPARGEAAAATPAVDVEAVLSALAAQNPQKLNWRTSIVDLMKLLQLDSSLGARQELARELGYTGNVNDSAAMNIWLHRQVMTKLAQNGGKVPEELKQAA